MGCVAKLVEEHTKITNEETRRVTESQRETQEEPLYTCQEDT
jgi:hypothetical protein